MDIQDVLKAKKASLEAVWVLMEPGLEDAREELEIEASAARIYDGRHTDAVKRADAVEARIDDLDQQIAESRTKFSFKSIGRVNYGKLLDEFKPREPKEEYETDHDVGFDVDEFPPRLLALGSVDPKMELKDAKEIWSGGEDGKWSDAETTKLLLCAIRANKETIDVPFTRLGSRMETLTIETESPTPETSGSPTPSS